MRTLTNSNYVLNRRAVQVKPMVSPTLVIGFLGFLKHSAAPNKFNKSVTPKQYIQVLLIRESGVAVA